MQILTLSTSDSRVSAAPRMNAPIDSLARGRSTAASSFRTRISARVAAAATSSPISCAAPAARTCSWSATSSTAGGCANPGTGTNTTTRCCGRSCATPAAAPRSPTSPATTTRCSAPGCRCGLEIAGIRLRQEAEHITADGKRLLVMHGDEFDSVVRYAKFLALLGDWAYTTALIVQPLVQRAAPPAGLSVLVAVGLAEAAGEGGGEGDRPVRERAGRRGAPPRLRRRGLRPYPPRRDARGARRAVPERRRLGGKLHRAGRASRRPAGTDRLGGAEPAVVLRAAPSAGCAKLPDASPSTRRPAATRCCLPRPRTAS